MKVFYEQMNIGHAKYVVNVHDGIQTHSDRSPFYGIAIFRNQKAKNLYVRELLALGYTERA